MNAQIPFPSFDDIRKLLHFWIDQQDKWFYFENSMIQMGKLGEITNLGTSLNVTSERFQYFQSRIIGKIFNVVEYPPSLLLHDATIFTVNLKSRYGMDEVTNIEKRNQYGLVFSEISYYEPIENIDAFISNDIRVKKE